MKNEEMKYPVIAWGRKQKAIRRVMKGYGWLSTRGVVERLYPHSQATPEQVEATWGFSELLIQKRTCCYAERRKPQQRQRTRSDWGDQFLVVGEGVR